MAIQSGVYRGCKQLYTKQRSRRQNAPPNGCRLKKEHSLYDKSISCHNKGIWTSKSALISLNRAGRLVSNVINIKIWITFYNYFHFPLFERDRVFVKINSIFISHASPRLCIITNRRSLQRYMLWLNLSLVLLLFSLVLNSLSYITIPQNKKQKIIKTKSRIKLSHSIHKWGIPILHSSPLHPSSHLNPSLCEYLIR